MKKNSLFQSKLWCRILLGTSFLGFSGKVFGEVGTPRNPLRRTTEAATPVDSPAPEALTTTDTVTPAKQEEGQAVPEIQAGPEIQPVPEILPEAALEAQVIPSFYTASEGRASSPSGSGLHQQTAGASILKNRHQEGLPAEEEIVAEGEIVYEHEDAILGMGGDCCGGGGCGECCIRPCSLWDNMEILTGVHGFTNAANRGQTGSFGFHYGMNWGIPIFNGALGAQVGILGTNSNFSGTSFTPDERQQTFVTTGVFRRADGGLQYGVVLDYLHEDWYFNTDLTQIRGEMSWKFACCHELGFWMAAQSKSETQESRIIQNDGQSVANGVLTLTVLETWEATDLYAFFYRRQLDSCGAEYKLSAGFSGSGDGLLAGEIRLPFSPGLALQAGATYVIPEESQSFGPNSEVENEVWNVGISLVWYPGCNSRRSGQSYYRPLFNVADNGTFIVGQP